MNKFHLWAPKCKKVTLVIEGVAHAMTRCGDRGYWQAEIDQLAEGTDYAFQLDDDPKPYPDPRSSFQPYGVNGASRTYNQKVFKWTDDKWQAPPLSSAVIYEVHIGTFTAEGTLEAAVEKIQYLCDLGITHVELMPLAEAAGEFGWGYDGVGLYAVHHKYGGPDSLKRFVDACHNAGLAVILDVVYNHFGPEGNYTGNFAPYTTDKHHTPWGDAINFEDRGSDEVRNFYLDNASMWFSDFHIDGLRLDAVHEIVDRSAVHFLESLATHVKNLSAQLGRNLVLIAESDLNDPKLIVPSEAYGYDLDAQWSDDFHHALFSVLCGERSGYYEDFGSMAALAKAIRSVFVYDGRYSVYRARSHGRPIDGLSAHRFVVYVQNHDQVGNRARGERLEHLVGVPLAKVALGMLLTLPFIPLLFQGEEFASSSPFQYFADHEDEDLAKAVAAGRKKEFKAFGWNPEQIPDPSARGTFLTSRLRWQELESPVHAEVLMWTKSLIKFRRTSNSLRDGNLANLAVIFDEERRLLRIDRDAVSVMVNIGSMTAEFSVVPKQEIILASDSGAKVIGQSLLAPPQSIAIVSKE